MEKLAWLHLRLAALTPWKNNYNQQSAHIIYAVRSIMRSVALSPIRRRSPVQVSLQSALVHGCAASFAKVSSAAILIVLVSCIFEHQCWCLLNGFFFLLTELHHPEHQEFKTCRWPMLFCCLNQVVFFPCILFPPIAAAPVPYFSSRAFLLLIGSQLNHVHGENEGFQQCRP